MPGGKVSDYKISVHRRHVVDESLRFERAVRRIDLSVVGDDTRVHVWFVDEETDPTIRTTSTWGRMWLGVLEVMLPLRDYADMYHVLQTESPVWVAWAFDDDGWVEGFEVNTRAEEVGEGLRDVTPEWSEWTKILGWGG
jgi:hypothetical protein